MVVKIFETAPAYSRTVKSALAIVKKVNMSCRASVRLIHLAVKKLPNEMGFVISSHMK